MLLEQARCLHGMTSAGTIHYCIRHVMYNGLLAFFVIYTCSCINKSDIHDGTRAITRADSMLSICVCVE